MLPQIFWHSPSLLHFLPVFCLLMLVKNFQVGCHNYGNGIGNEGSGTRQQFPPPFFGQQSPQQSFPDQQPFSEQRNQQQSPALGPKQSAQTFTAANDNGQQQLLPAFDESPPFPGQPFSGQQSRPFSGQNGNIGSSVGQCNNRLPPISRLHNWGGNFHFSTQNIEYPRTTEEVQQIVRRARKLRVVGSRHSFSKIADSPDTMISTLGMNNIITVNPTVPSVIVQAGMTYTDLCPFLHSLGLALPILGALGEITIGGAISTGAHGSGMSHPNLADQLLSMELVMANGSVATFRRGDPQWNGLAVGLGAFGVMTKVELQLMPAFGVITYVFLNMPLANLFNNFNAIMSIGYSVQLISTMTNPNIFDQIWILVRTDHDPNNVGQMNSLFGAKRATSQVTPNAVLPATYLVNQGIKLPWYEGLVQYKMGFSGADGNEIQTEWILPFENAVPAMKVLASMSAELAPIIYIWDIRTIKADQFWMSPSSGNNGGGRNAIYVAIHFTWKPAMNIVLAILPKINAALAPFNARPHWGKLFTLHSRQFLHTYPNAQQFVRMANQFDPTGKFRNEFLEENVFVR